MASPTSPSTRTRRPAPRRAWTRLIGASPIERVLNAASALAILILLAVIVLWRLPSDYLILLPASAQGVDAKIYVAGHPPASGRGQLYMTFVSEPDSNKLQELFARLDPDASLEPKPPAYSPSADQQANIQMMATSEQLAALVALCHDGYPNLCRSEIGVQSVLPYSKARGILLPGDIITALNGQPVAIPDQLRAALATLKPGATAAVTVTRAGKSITLRIPTIASPSERGRTVLGIALAIMLPPPPIDIKIQAGDIGGPSAGLMFTLGVLNRLSPTDLTRNHCIAGTGTIGLDGTVGAIGGVKQKVIGAEWAHAQYFLVPLDGGNYTDARKAVGPHMTLVPVRTLDDAIAFLKRLPPAAAPCH